LDLYYQFVRKRVLCCCCCLEKLFFRKRERWKVEKREKRPESHPLSEMTLEIEIMRECQYYADVTLFATISLQKLHTTPTLKS